jgi:hypothetical protein
MPLFFLHIRDGAVLIRDPEGGYFPDITAARAEAIESARELMSQSILRHARIGIERQFEITNENGKTVAVVGFDEAIH